MRLSFRAILNRWIVWLIFLYVWLANKAESQAELLSMKVCFRARAVLNHWIVWLFFLCVWLEGRAESRAEVTPVIRQSDQIVALEELGRMARTLNRHLLVEYDTDRISIAGMEGAPDPVGQMEQAFSAMRLPFRSRRTSASDLPPGGQNRVRHTLRGGISIYDRAIRTRLSSVTIETLVEIYKKYFQMTGQVEFEDEVSKLSFGLSIVSDDGLVVGGRSVEVSAMLFKSRRDRRLGMVFFGNGFSALQSVVFLDGPHEALQALLYRCVFLCVARDLELPYWKCSLLDRVDSHLPGFWRDTFLEADPAGRVRGCQTLLFAHGFKSVRTTGVMDIPTEIALERYCLRNDWPATTTLSPDLFVELHLSLPTARSLEMPPSGQFVVELSGRHSPEMRQALNALWNIREVREVSQAEPPRRPAVMRGLRRVLESRKEPPNSLRFTVRTDAEPWKIQRALAEAVGDKFRTSFFWKNTRDGRCLVVMTH